MNRRPTRVATGRPDGALDDVYKLALAKAEPRIKVSENLAKITLPGRKQVHRYFDSNGMLFGADGIACADEPAPERLIHLFDDHKSMRCQGVRSESLLEPMMKRGRRVAEPRSVVEDVRSHCAQCLALLPPECRWFESPHIYKVGISEQLQKMRDELRSKYV